jgi:transposase
MQHHRHREFIRFLNAIEEQVPVGKVIHAIVDYATHKHPKVRQWLARHPRWTFHFTPTSASWLNAVEGFFAKLTRQRLKRGVFRSVIDLQVAINRFLAETNLNPKPFGWTAGPKRLLAAVKRGEANVRGRFEIVCQACSSSSGALASFRSSVLKPSVNQP